LVVPGSAEIEGGGALGDQVGQRWQGMGLGEPVLQVGGEADAQLAGGGRDRLAGVL
jgi:hypothetical protein